MSWEYQYQVNFCYPFYMSTILHLIVGFIFAGFFYLLNLPFELICLFYFWTALLIDIDHIFYFIYKTRSINPKKIFEKSMEYRKVMRPAPYLFHTIEFNVILIVITLFSQELWLQMIAFGSLIHLLMDVYEHTKYYKSLLWIKNWSVIVSVSSVFNI